jgi:putative ABC transport system permease protein
MSRRRPVFERLLLWVVGQDVRGRSMAGDLREEYGQRSAGALNELRYALSCLRLAGRYLPVRMLEAARRAASAGVLDLRQSARGFRSAPTYWIGCTLTLALGIGATSTIATIVYGSLLEPLPYPHPERLVRFGDATLKNPVGLSSASVLNFMGLQRSAGTFDVMAAFRSERAIVSGPDGADRLQGAWVTPNFFEVFELTPLAGRWFEPADQSSGARTVIISERAWRRLFGGRRDAIGRTIQIDLVDHTVIGIAGRDQSAHGAVDFWKTIRWNADDMTLRRRRSIEPVGRLRAGTTIEEARHELRALFAALGREYPAENAAWTINVMPIEEWIGSFGGASSRAMLQLIGAGAVVLLAVALINVTSLTLGRAEQRRRDALLRRALGATSGRMFALHLTEGLLIGVPAGIAGAVIASWAVPLVVAQYGDTFPRSHTVAFGASSVLVAAGAGIVAAFCIAALAGLRRRPATDGLRTDARGASAASLRVRLALVTTEVALSALLLHAAMLVAGTIYALSRVDMGVPLDRALTFEVGLPRSRYPDPDRIARFLDELSTRLHALPGVREVGATTRRPFAGGSNGGVSVADDPARTLPLVEYRAVTPGFFPALGIALHEGRTFAAGLGAGAAESSQVVISEQLARELFGPSSAVGRLLRTATSAPPVEVIGVVGDFRDFGPVREGRPTIYFRHSFNEVYANSPFSTVIVRHEGSGADLTLLTRAVLRDLDRDVPMDAIMTLQTLADRSAGTSRRTAATLLLWFTGVALALGSVGIFGVIAFSVERRRREIGIRLAVGDTPAGIGRRILVEGLKLTAIGLAVAALGSYWIRNAVASFVLADLTPASWRVLAGVVAVVALIAVTACLIPARRAARTPLITVLRE